MPLPSLPPNHTSLTAAACVVIEAQEDHLITARAQLPVEAHESPQRRSLHDLRLVKLEIMCNGLKIAENVCSQSLRLCLGLLRCRASSFRMFSG